MTWLTYNESTLISSIESSALNTILDIVYPTGKPDAMSAEDKLRQIEGVIRCSLDMIESIQMSASEMLTDGKDSE